MIIPLKVKIPVSLENTSEMSLETTQRARRFRWLETATFHKTEWTKFSENIKENQTIHLPSTENSWQVANNFTALFSRASTAMSVASVPCPLNRTWGGAHTPRSPRTVIIPCPCILNEKSHYNSPSILNKRAAEETLKTVLRFSFA